MGIELGFADGDDVQLKGATDATLIGNVSDRLKVDASFSTPPTTKEIENPTFILAAQDVSIGSNKSMVSLLNGVGSVVKICIREIYVVNTQTTLTLAGVVSNFSVLRITGHSAGTLLTPAAYDTNDVLNLNVTSRTGATVAGEGTALLKQVKWSSDEWGVGTLDQEGFDHGLQALIPLYKCGPKMKPITLNVGQGITVKHTVASANGTFDVVILFTQE